MKRPPIQSNAPRPPDPELESYKGTGNRTHFNGTTPAKPSVIVAPPLSFRKLIAAFSAKPKGGCS